MKNYTRYPEYVVLFEFLWRLTFKLQFPLIRQNVSDTDVTRCKCYIHLNDSIDNDALRERTLICTINFSSSALGGDLQKVIDDNNVPFEADVVKFVHHVVEGLAYMHQRKIAHLDIKVSEKRVKDFFL